ncbi:MAG TPA: 30S ribosomal protein S6 [Firmicutes bacterium]|nr:30S ribosomal protein S6 [Bacillota bacterium]
MHKYEMAVVLRPDLDEETKAAESQKVMDLITRFGGTIEKVDDWGKRRLAYEIQKVNEGFFSFISFDADSTAPAELESRMRIMENVLRYLIVRKDV